jgi:CO/xanthine dehydrogenase Mo-binding subunit
MKRSTEIFQIGKSAPRADARAKVTGREKYAADYYSENQLWAGVKRAGIAHADLLEIELDAAGKLPGIVKVLTSEDVKGSNRQGVARKDQPVLVDDKIRHAGDAVALVVAESQEQLKKALNLITLKSEALPEIFTMAAALA